MEQPLIQGIEMSPSEKLVHLYFTGIVSGQITYDEMSMRFMPGADIKFAASLIDLENEIYGLGFISAERTRKFKEFKQAIKLAESPLAKALK